MSAILNIILPVFALILLGWFVAKTPVWHKDATGHFNRFVFWVALPAMLFGKLAAGGAFAGVEPLIAAASKARSAVSDGMRMSPPAVPDSHWREDHKHGWGCEARDIVFAGPDATL